MKLKPYPKYKDSGVEWLGEVPEHWNLVSCRGFVNERTSRNDDGANENYLSLMANIGIIPYEEKGDVGNKKPEDLTKCKLVYKGDFVINSMNYGIGSYGLSPYDGVCSPVYIVLKPRNDVVETGFATRVFENKAFQAYAQSFGNGILEHRAAINWDILKGISVGLPPIKEQSQILSFLDRETTKLDTLIAKQEKLIELLQEKRQAVISHAVTKGLDPDAPMKDSGVEWLGMVPAHWRVGKIKWSIQTTSGATPNTNQQGDYYDGDIPWVRSLDLNNGIIDKWEIGITQTAITETACKILPIGSVLIAMYGGDGTIGKNGLLGIEATTNQAICALLPNKRFSSVYLLRFMQHQRPYWMVGAEGTRKDPNISQDIIRDAFVLEPPTSEQEKIATYLDQETAKIDLLIEKAQRSIELAKEHRTALISAAVTGKIDVRDQAQEASYA